ncbi:PepSY-associated TM helix domain-containing protein [Paenibacillus hamazuiensis]|uniref:PepSY-associated TM helix domain-containing protein n=1 Tax=Paenibacillus hamazuiensis TaxID=2936508 RepID=UPI00200C6F5F|nr:PepSY-associated TM helix domain-containing protein [Paenibacillus hamazuiensis]
MKKNRQLHLWIGFICSVFILVESVTGLILSEPWLVGAGKGEGGGMRPQMAVQSQAAPGGAALSANGSSGQTQGQAEGQAQSSQFAAGSPSAAAEGSAAPAARQNGEGAGVGAKAVSSLYGMIKGLHEGRVGGTNVKILADLTAIGLIFLTVSGIVLSIQTLRAQAKSRKRRKADHRLLREMEQESPA